MASRRSAVEPFRAMDLMAEAFKLQRAGRSIIHLAVGEPGAPTPRCVREAAATALHGGRIGYTEALGMPALRSRISTYYGEKHGLDIPADRIAVTTGSSAGFNLAFLALFDVGDRIALPTPGYPAYRNILRALGLEVVEIPTTAEMRWTITPDALAEAHAGGPLKGLILASPNNPNGTMIAPDCLAAVVGACGDLGIRLIMDEIYHGLTYGFPTKSALAFTDDVIVINSFSKYYCMTGWRVGWMVVPPEIVRTVECLSQNIALSVNALSQHAGIAAFDATEELETVKARYAANRDLLLKRLPEIGLAHFHPADGAFYIYADVSQFTDDSMSFARTLLEQAGVSVAPGVDFDSERGAGHIRLSFAGNMGDVAEGIERIGRWVR
jgi:aspartate/methionine/tyrosine aminotransferase